MHCAIYHRKKTCLLDRAFPEEQSEAKVFPLPKTGSKTDLNNYRLIFILNSLSKICERLVYNSLKILE